MATSGEIVFRGSTSVLVLRETVLNEADNGLKEIETMTQRRFLPIVGLRKGPVLVDVIRSSKPKRVLEIGTLIGYSAVLIGKELENKAHLITIEIHADEAEVARENIRRAKVHATVDVIVGNVIDIIPKLTGEFDMVFIDAEKEEYIDYLRLVEQKLHKGSVIVADNAGIFANQMSEYLDYVRSSGEYSSKYVPVEEDGLEVSVKL